MNKFSTIGKTFHSNHWRTTAQKKKNTLGQWDEAGKKPKLASRENVNGSLRQNQNKDWGTENFAGKVITGSQISLYTSDPNSWKRI